MPANVMQKAFHSGEWAPSLNARVDLQKYHSAAALIRNFYVDYRGGISSRAGTQYVLKAYKGSTKVRLIPFQASPSVAYVLEFGDGYIRFHINKAPVLETAKAIAGITQANPAVVNVVAHGYSSGEWVFITGVVGMTQVNGRYFIVQPTDANHYSLQDLNGVAVNSSAYTAYSSGGTSARVYTLPSPYAAADLGTLKFAQNVNTMVICHPNYGPYILTLITATNWTINLITFGATIPAPTGQAVTSTIAAGPPNVFYSYQITAVDFNGQESAPSAAATVGNIKDQTTDLGTNSVTWTGVSGAQYYNIYRATRRYTNAVAAGATHGFIGYTRGVLFADTNIASDFSLTPPVPQNPFVGGPVASVTITAPGSYTVVPSVTFAAPSAGQTATGLVTLGVVSAVKNSNIAGTFTVGEILQPTTPTGGLAGVRIVVATIDGGGNVLTFQPMTFPGSAPGSISGVGNLTFSNPRAFSGAAGFVNVDLTWGVINIAMVSGGTGYTAAPVVTFSAGAAAGTAVLGTSSGNPTTVAYFSQRLVLAGPPLSPGQLNFSRPAAFLNFDISNPLQADDAIQATLASLQLQTVKYMIPMTSGLITLTDKQVWLVNSGGGNAVITPIDPQANPQAFVGIGDIPPIPINNNIIYVQSKGSVVRDLQFNFYTNVYAGTDISVLSNQLFYGFSMLEWAYAEEPFKVVNAVRDDGQMLALTYVKEQELIGWTHLDTQGFFNSVASVVENNEDVIYTVVQRFQAGVSVQYIEAFARRRFPYGVEDAWCVDSGLQSAGVSPSATLTPSQSAVGAGVTFLASASVFAGGDVGKVIRVGKGIATITTFNSGTSVTGTLTQAISDVIPNTTPPTPRPAIAGTWTLWTPFTSFGGLEHLNGYSVYGLADGAVVGPFTVAAGAITLAGPATKVVLGLKYRCQLQTLPLEMGEPTVQGKRKKIVGVITRCQDTLGIKIGRTFGTLVPMKDFVIGNVGTMSNQVVTGLVTGDGRTIVDPQWEALGQFCIQQDDPLPVSILGVIPEVTIENVKGT